MRRQIGLRGRMVGIALATSLLTVFVVQTLILGFVTYSYLYDESFPSEVATGLQHAVADGAEALAEGDRETVRSIIDRNASLISPPIAPIGNEEGEGMRISAAVLDARQRVFAATIDWKQFEGSDRLPLPPAERKVLDQAWAGKTVALRYEGRLIASAPVRYNDRVIGVALVRSPEVFRLEWVAIGVAQRLATSLLVTGSVAALIGWFTGIALSRWVGVRLNGLTEVASEWQTGNLDRRAMETPTDEIGALAVRLNRMADGFREVLALRREVSALEERRRLTRDLHDTVKQQAFATHLLLTAAQDHLKSGHPESATKALVAADQACQSLQRELRAIFEHLRAPVAQDFAAAVRAIADRWEELGALRVITELDSRFDDILPGHREQLLMAIEEAVANVVKHAQARECSVRLSKEDAEWELTVQDDGIGIDPQAESATGIGLASLRERAKILGGELRLERPPEGGTRLRLTFPRWTALGRQP